MKKVGWITVFFMFLGVLAAWLPANHPLHIFTQNIHASITRTLAPSQCTRCNIVIFSIDLLRADKLPCYGYIHDTGPSMCRFGRTNVFFDQAFSQSSLTYPNEASVFTSLYPTNHSLNFQVTDVKHPSVQTLPKILRQAGYHTVYVGISQEYGSPLVSQLAGDFDEQIYVPPDSINSQAAAWKQALAKLENRSIADPPLFIYIYIQYLHDYWHNFDTETTFLFDPSLRPRATPADFHFTPITRRNTIDQLEFYLYKDQAGEHEQLYKQVRNVMKSSASGVAASQAFDLLPESVQHKIYINGFFDYVDPNDPRDARYVEALYTTRLKKLDALLGPLLAPFDTKPYKNSTIAILMSDHGENLGDHESFSHTHPPTDSLTHVPLIIHIPAMGQKRVSDIVETLDLYPTLLSSVGLPIAGKIAGENLLPILLGQVGSKGYAISEFYTGNMLYRSIRTQDWRLISSQTRGNEPYAYALYHSITDPREAKNVADLNPALVTKLYTKMVTAIEVLPRYNNYSIDR